jgi:hypothetical protein
VGSATSDNPTGIHDLLTEMGDDIYTVPTTAQLIFAKAIIIYITKWLFFIFTECMLLRNLAVGVNSSL